MNMNMHRAEYSRPNPDKMVFECDEPEVGSAFIVIRERWEEHGKRAILEWRYPTEEEKAEFAESDAIDAMPDYGADVYLSEFFED